MALVVASQMPFHLAITTVGARFGFARRGVDAGACPIGPLRNKQVVCRAPGSIVTRVSKKGDR